MSRDDIARELAAIEQWIARLRRLPYWHPEAEELEALEARRRELVARMEATSD